MTSESVAQLRQNLKENADNYKSKKIWVDSYLQSIFTTGNWSLESKISYEVVELTTGDGKSESKYDAENAKRIHHSLRHLTPAQATDPRIWTYLAHTVYYDYMQRRWLNKEQTAMGTLTRFFATTNRELIRNGIARLWWYGYLTFDSSRKDPYELTDLLLSNQDIAQGLLERKLGNNKEWLLTILDCIMKYKEEHPDITKSASMTKIMKQLNYAGGVSLLDVLNKDDMELLFQGILKKIEATPQTQSV